MGTAFAIVGVLIGMGALYLAVAPQRSAKRLRSVDRFGQTRRYLKRQVGPLFVQSLAEQERFQFDRELPILTRRQWIPSRPLPLESVSLQLRDISPAEDLTEAKQRVRRYLPCQDGGGEIETYSEAVGLFDRPQIWFDSCSYRLLGVRTGVETAPGSGKDALQLTFGLARYFDGQDTSEFLAYEAADRAARAKRGLTRGAYRAWLSDPFDFRHRCALPGISVLTIRRSDREAFFFMHRRDGSKVAVSMNATNVAPAGEFQPHNDILPVWRTDLDIWRSVMREYAEEFLGFPESTGQGGAIIDYENDEPYRQFVKAKSGEDVTIRFLGIGIDPLSWKPLICLVCLWKDAVFDRIFKGMTEANKEGVLIIGERERRGYRGIRFSADNVLGYASDAVTEPPGRTCLALTWRWRHVLGIPGVD